MNRLVEYLFRHYHPGGKACRPVLVKNLVKDGSFSMEGIYLMACEAHEAGLLDWGFTSEHGHYFPSQYTYKDLFSIALTRKGLGREFTYPPKGFKNNSSFRE
jgi:hypothetical protein